MISILLFKIEFLLNQNMYYFQYVFRYYGYSLVLCGGYQQNSKYFDLILFFYF